MESILALFVNYDTYVLSFLVAGITIIFLLLIFSSFKNPEDVVMDEMADSEHIEGALRRVLGEQRWLNAGQGGGSVDTGAVKKLESEILQKDKEIAKLHKQMTQNPGGGSGNEGGSDELQARINDLEARLREYEIIEDDIADLSLYKTENEKLRAELAGLKNGQATATEVSAVVAEDEIAVSHQEAPAKATAPVDEEWAGATDDTNDTDLMAEFAKVISNQEALDNGEVEVVAPEKEPKHILVDSDPSIGVVEMLKSHPKLSTVKPDSKEEAEVFITDLKTLKKGS
ncbi:MAG: hypothetical protein KDD33_04460 [Bdellovibrionales bacterium]|nr:hypothetical protein [Bdellovibrionales bacterium]